jgi:hypothetical protein
MTSLSEASRKALEARSRMLNVRPKDAIPPLPERIGGERVNCLQYFEIAAILYSKAAEAYSMGDIANGQVYELWAYQHMLVGQACQEQMS